VKTSYSHQREIRAVFERVCADRGLLILVTQYLKFESRFMLLDGNEVHVQTAPGGDEALRVLGVSDIALRFPCGHDFLGAPTKMTGFSTVEDKRTVRFALPTLLEASDSRKAPRTSLTEGAFVTFPLRGKRMIQADIANISVSGLRLHLTEDVPSSELRLRDRLMLSISLPGDISILNGATIRNTDYRNIGAEFDPPLSDYDMAILSRWVFKKCEEEREQKAKREDAAMGAAPKTGSAGAKGGAVGEGILLVTADPELKASLLDIFGKDWKPMCTVPSSAAVSHAVLQRPLMAIVHVSGRDEAGRQFLAESLSDALPLGFPILLLGTDIDSEDLSELARKCGAVVSMQMAPNKAQFLQRLVVGILRKHYGHGESPMAV